MNGSGKRTKRRKDSADSQHSEKAKKCRKKKPKKSREKSEDNKRTSSPSHTVSDPALSDSEEDYSLCAAPWCREPEGDEVCFILSLFLELIQVLKMLLLFWEEKKEKKRIINIETIQ